MTNHKLNNASSDQLNKVFRRANLDMSQYCSVQNASKTIKQQHNFNKLLHVNIRSINAGLDKLNDLLALTELSPDIILVSETKLKTSENLNHFIKGFKFMHKGTRTNWGGIGIFTKENIRIKVYYEFDLNIPDCEDIWVQIELKHGKKCVIGVIYYHPKQNLKRFHLSFEKVLELLSCKNVTYYIGGDFNIKLLQNENKVKAYIDMTYSLGAIPLITHPTRVTDNSSALLDHVYTINISGETHSYILLDNISDHMPVIVCSDLALKHPKKYEASYVRDTKNFEAELFLEELSKSLHLLGETNLPNNINEIDIYTDKFIHIFQLILDKHAPLRKRSRKELKLKTKPWITKRLLKSIHPKNHMYKKCVNSSAQLNGTNTRCTEISSLI